MDESLVEIGLDLSGRNFCSFDAEFNREMVGDLSVELVKHLFCVIRRRPGVQHFISKLQVRMHTI